MAFDLTDPVFNNEEAARAYFEVNPLAPICPHCGVIDQATLVNGKSHRPGMFRCNTCTKPFTVTLGSVMESSHVPAAQVGAGVPLHGGEQEGCLGPSAHADAWARLISHRLAYGASRS